MPHPNAFVFPGPLQLNDEGRLELDDTEPLDESTENEIFQWAYPILDETLSKVYGDGKYDSFERLPRDRKATITRSIRKERVRVKSDKSKVKPPQTEHGRELKKVTDLPTVRVDELIRKEATEVLKKFSRRGKPH